MNSVFERKTKTVYIDTGEKRDRKNSVLGAVFLFLCVFAGCFGIASCFIDSFKFEVSKLWIAGEILKYLLVFTAAIQALLISNLKDSTTHETSPKQPA
jgi:uncharacterized membrane protein YgdD (TMEM256/DUF423 family)